MEYLYLYIQFLCPVYVSQAKLERLVLSAAPVRAHSREIATLLGYDYGSEVVHQHNLVIVQEEENGYRKAL